MKVSQYIESKSRVTLLYFNERIWCQILKESEKLILIRDIKDWHYDAYMIIPKKYIRKIKYGKNEKCRESILPELSQLPEKIEKLDISSIYSVLNQLYQMDQGVCIENARIDGLFAIGKIIKTKNKKVTLKEIDLCGQFKQKGLEIRYKDITSIFFDDEYSSKLFSFVKLK